MTIEASVYSRCTTHGGLAALIGTRCYPQRLPDNATLPAMVYHLISTPLHDYNDHGGGLPDRWRYRIQFDGYAATQDARASLRNQIMAAWNGYNAGTAIGWAWVKNVLDDYDVALNADKAIVEVIVDAAT